MNKTKRILIISEIHLIKTFLLPTILKLKESADVVFDCFIVATINDKVRKELEANFENVFANQYPKGLLGKIPKLRFFQSIYGLRKLAASLPHYEVAHINFHHFYYSLFTPIIRKKVNKLYISFFGSDFNELEWYRHLGNKKTIRITDNVFSTNSTLLKEIKNKYNLSEKKIGTSVLMPMIDAFIDFEELLLNKKKEDAKKELGIDNKLMVCGYNAAPIVRHKEIIIALLNIKENLKDFQLIFPMTYGLNASVTRINVKNLLLNSGFNYQIFEEYLPIEKILNIRLAADIFIHIQSRDQMCSSMLEHLAAGSLVITGEWLPYNSLKEKGVYFIEISKVGDLEKAAKDAIQNLDYHLEMCKVNREIIFSLMKWENNKAKWLTAYNITEK